MIYSITSGDPNNYSKVSTKINPPWYCSKVKYYVKSINTTSNFYITTDEDFIIFDIGEEPNIYVFPNKSSYDFDTLAETINEITPELNVEFTENKLLKFKNEKIIKIVDASHRVKLLLGLINMELPIEGKEIICKTVPTTTFYNKLYLNCEFGDGIILSNKNTNNDNGIDYVYPNICYVIDTFMKDGLPIILNKKQMSIKTAYSDLKRLTFQLVDIYMCPVKLLSPLSITIILKPLKL